MPYRTIADGDGTPMRVRVELDPDEQMEAQRDELERDLAAYDAYIDSKLDEWRETGVRPSIRPYRSRRA